ncbi:hypothetical protein Aph01nite_43910 [Acrocarpospora phusangensis]|uniref:Uncharacterized protein n=1 Tax=Acrocarpospora phusangensis TaxID=1070424 RepID=A0A919QC29_9ACTN|nr:hypothetical protein [Acrocarpospora phusangensis]GIH26081.1 hypothetical protein Aph01nite_43910 [Acrocarpospora phusangensis]
MIDDRPVIAWTPYGRRRVASILAAYMERDHRAGIIDEWWLYLNTDPDQADDLVYAHELAETYDWVRLVERPAGYPVLTPKQKNTGLFYLGCTDPDAVYVRLDDDIVYLHEAAIPNLVRAKLTLADSVLCAFPIIINNAVVSWHLQQQRRIPGPSKGWESVQLPYCMDSVGWASGDFAVKLHEFVLGKIEAGAVEDLYMHHTVTLPDRQQFSVSCFATLGSDYTVLDPPGYLGAEEEFWHSVHRPKQAGRSNIIVDTSVVAHWSFYHQHAELDASGLLDRYRKLAASL